MPVINQHALSPVTDGAFGLGDLVKPEFGPKWQLRFQMQFLFPK